MFTVGKDPYVMRVLHLLKRRSLVSLGVVFAGHSGGLSPGSLSHSSNQPLHRGQCWISPRIPVQARCCQSGDIVISGVAFDPTATEGTSRSICSSVIEIKVACISGARYLAQDVMEGLTPGSPAAVQSFQVKVLIPTTLTGGMDLRAYAHSALTGKETVVSTPIYLAIAPAPMATTAWVASIQHLLAGASAEAFSLANPSAADVVSTGDYMTLNDRLGDQFFLGERDTGGTVLGTTTPEDGKFSAAVTIPSHGVGRP